MATIEDVVNKLEEIVQTDEKKRKILLPTFGDWIDFEDIFNIGYMAYHLNLYKKTSALKAIDIDSNPIWNVIYNQRTVIAECLEFYRSLGEDFFVFARKHFDYKDDKKKVLFRTEASNINRAYYFGRNTICVRNLARLSNNKYKTINRYPLIEDRPYEIEDVVSLTHEIGHSFDAPFNIQEEIDGKLNEIEYPDLNEHATKSFVSETTAIFFEMLCTDYLMEKHPEQRKKLMKNRALRLWNSAGHLDNAGCISDVLANYKHLKVEKLQLYEKIRKILKRIVRASMPINSKDKTMKTATVEENESNNIEIFLKDLADYDTNKPYGLALPFCSRMYKEYYKDPVAGKDKLRRYLEAVKNNHLKEALSIWNIDIKSKEGVESMIRDAIELCDETSQYLAPKIKKDPVKEELRELGF